jgi:pyridoxal phosphate enzyme (YggS family)
MSTLLENYKQVLNRIQQACKNNHRDPGAVSLLAVSKTKPIEDIQELAKHGQNAFGENYVQEALTKIEIEPELEWHFIGPIQSNKTKHIAQQFAWVHSVDRLKIAQRLNDQRPSELPPLNVLLEVNISREQSKSGFTEDEVISIAKQIATMPNLSLRGLMAIPQPSDNYADQLKPFRAVKQLLAKLQQELPDAQLDSLSMGMSADLEAAIAEGATIVRIGTDVFGAREYSNIRR